MRLFIAVAAALCITAGMCAPAFAGSSVTGSLMEVLYKKGVIDDASYNELKKAGETGGDQAVNAKLVEVLHAKGVIDDATYTNLTAMAAQEAQAAAQMASNPPASPQSSSSGERPFDKALTSVEEGFAKLGGDTVKMKIGVLFQGGWLSDSAGFSVGVPPNTGASISTTASNQFFVRRARLIFSGEIAPKLGFKISSEFAPTSNTLQDAYVWADYIPYARITLGQFKPPFSLENYVDGIGDIPTINRALVSNMMINASLKDTSLTRSSILRDMGVMVSGKYQTKVGGLPFGATYAVGVFNGPGRGLADDNNTKDVVGRVTINPLVAGLNIGGSWATGKTHHTLTVPALVFNKDRDRWGAEIEYLPDFAKGLKLRGEFMWDRRYFSSYVSKTTSAFTRDTHTYGWYALAAYKVDGQKGVLAYLNGFEPVLRYDFMDEDTSSMTVSSRDNGRTRYTLGCNYYPNKYTRVMLNYEVIHADKALSVKSLENIDTISHNLFTTLVQIKF